MKNRVCWSASKFIAFFIEKISINIYGKFLIYHSRLEFDLFAVYSHSRRKDHGRMKFDGEFTMRKLSCAKMKKKNVHRIFQKERKEPIEYGSATHIIFMQATNSTHTYRTVKFHSLKYAQYFACLFVCTAFLLFRKCVEIIWNSIDLIE